MAQETVQEYKKRVATAGGNAIKNKYGKKHFSEIGKKGLNKRYKKKSRLKALLFE